MDKKDDFFISEEVAEWVGLKKSEYLSKLISLQTHDDIGIEQFHRFEKYIQGTIEDSDKTLQADIDGYTVRTYLRTYGEDSGFHQIVLGAVIPDKATKNEIFVPILILVSRNKDLVMEFCEGEVLSKPTLN